MKKILALLMLGCMLTASATPHHRRHHRHHRPAARHVAWKPILAGGTAAGVVIASYKISDGVESGLKTAARTNPEAFLQSVTPWALPVRIILIGGTACLVYFIIKKGKNHENLPK